MRRPMLMIGACAAIVGAVVVGAVTAFACIPIAILQVNPGQAAAGGSVQLFIHEINGSGYPPVTFHWDAVDGPVLATVQPTDDTQGVGATVTVPANATPGYHLFIATEPLPQQTAGEWPSWGMPVRGAIYVTSGSGGTVPALSNPAQPTAQAGLSTGPSLSTAVLALIALGVAVVAAALAAGVAVAFRSRRGAAAGPTSAR